ELLAFHGTRRYRYEGNRVTGTVQPVDSAARQLDRAFPYPVFAFSEVDLLACSLPFHPGASFVVPLFSEMDEDLETDTLTVVGRDTTSSAARWVVRFADPAIVS